jgi:hypothetical protein
MTRKIRFLVSLIIVVLVAIGSGRARAEESQTKAIVRIADEINFDAVGNATGESEIVLPQEVYAKVKTLMSSRELVQENGQQVTKLRAPRIENVLKYLGITSTAYEVTDVKGEFDDDASTIHVTYGIKGRCLFRHNQWEFPVVRDPDTKVEVRRVDIKSETVKMELRAKLQGVQVITRLTLRLPQGATKIDFRKKTLDVVYHAPAPAAPQNATATRPEMRLDAKPQVMSALYKLYGNPKWAEMWPARSIFQNETAETLADYRVRFRIDGYSS